jgi:hypothetical protein
MARKIARRGTTKGDVERARAKTRTARVPRTERNEGGKRNKIHVSLFVDGQDVTLIDEFNTPAEAIAACREFLDAHTPQPLRGSEQSEARSQK